MNVPNLRPQKVQTRPFAKEETHHFSDRQFMNGRGAASAPRNGGKTP